MSLPFVEVHLLILDNTRQVVRAVLQLFLHLNPHITGLELLYPLARFALLHRNYTVSARTILLYYNIIICYTCTLLYCYTGYCTEHKFINEYWNR